MDFGPGTGGSGAGYYGGGSQTNPYFQFLVPYAYVNGGYGNNYEYGQVTIAEQGGFGGGQSPIGLVTAIDKITGDGTTATCNTHVPHGYPYSYVVNISGTTYYDGIQQIQVQASNVFTFASSNTQTVTTGTVAGFPYGGSSGGGGYTGSPGDGTQGATCYADPSVQNFTDLGANSNASGYVTISLVSPTPITQSPTWNQTWTVQPSVFPYPTTWTACAYGNGTYVAVSNNGTYPVTYSPDGINWYTQTYGASLQSWVSVAFGNELFVAVASNGHSMVSPDGINWTEAVGNGTAWTSVAGGNGIFTATATDIGATYSPDGLNWTTSSVVQPDTWTAVTYGQGTFNITNAPFISNGQNSYEEFGYAIALSADGSILAVGAPYGNNSNGNVYVYTNGQLSYTAQGQDAYANFGQSVALSANGSILAAAAFNQSTAKVYVYNNGSPQYNVQGPDSYDFFGQSIALSADGSILAVGAPYGNSGMGAVYVYTNGQLSYTAQGQNAYVAFGSSVALSADGSILAVGSANYNTVYVYTNGVSTYTVSETVSTSFGSSVALSADGSILAVSAFALYGGVGAVYVYKNETPQSFNPLQTGSSDDNFGQGLAMSADGSVLAVGAPTANGITGAVYLYINGVLSETVYSIDTLATDTYFGQSVALYADGSYLAVGAPNANYNTGYVALYRPPSNYTSLFVAVANNGTTANVMYSSDGNIWSNATTGSYLNDAWLAVTYGNGTFVACASRVNFSKTNYGFNGSQNIALSSDGYVVAFGNPREGTVHVYTNGNISYTLHGQNSGDAFGSSIALSSDGSVLAVGAVLRNSYTGSVYVYTNGSLTYTLNGQNSNDVFGISVALSSSGSILAVGALGVNGYNGAVYVYANGTPLGFSPLQGNPGDQLGTSVALSSDGSVLAVSAPNANGVLGTVYVYTNGTLTQTLQNPDQSYTNSFFGSSVALSSDGTVLAVGTPSAFTHTPGYVYVFINGGTSPSYTLQAPTPHNSDVFGLTVSLSSDGSVLSTSSSYFYSYGPFQTYVYTNGTLTYTPVGQMCYSPVVNSDGSVLAVGDSTSAYVYIIPTTPTRIEYSTDGQNWSTGTSIPFSSGCITYGNGTFVALSSNPQTSQVAFTTDVTSSWQHAPVPSASYTGVTYGVQGFVGVSPTPFTIGFTPQFWVNPAQVSNANKLNSSHWNGLAYGNGTFVAVGTGLIQGTKDQGMTWNSFAVNNALCITYSQNLGTFVAIDITQTTYTSHDAVNWTQNTNFPQGFLTQYSQPSITYGNGLFVSVLRDSTWVFYSRDGVYWDVAYSPDVCASVTYGNGTFVAVGLDAAMSSIDGSNWNDQTVPSYSTWVSVTFGNGLFVAVSTDGGSMYSSDGVSWFPGNLVIDTWCSVTYGDGFFIAVSNSGTYPVAYSQDGINWVTQTTGFQTANWTSIAFGQNTFMALNAQGATTMITQFGETF